MDLKETLAELAGPTLEGMGYELVRVRLSGKERKVVQIMAEPADGRAMTVDDCAEISHALSALFDVEDPIHGAYTLEVSSPGIDRPLTRLKDFETYSGFDAKVETRFPIDGRRRWRGKVLGVSSAAGDTAPQVRLQTEQGDVSLPFAEIATAKLILTDALIAATQDAQSGQSAK